MRGIAPAIGLVAMTVGACSGAVSSAPASSTGTHGPTAIPIAAASFTGPIPAPSVVVDLPALRELAKGELKAWDESWTLARDGNPVKIVDPPNGQIGVWESAELANNYMKALAAGLVTAAPLPTEQPPDAYFDDGGPTNVDLPVISAQRAFEEIRLGARRSGATCPSCRPIRFTSAKLTRVGITSSSPMIGDDAGETQTHGSAPAWAFTMDNSAVVITRIALLDRVYPMPTTRDLFHPLGDVTFQTATGRADGGELTVGLVVPRMDAAHPCVMNYAAEAAESATAVVVIVTPLSDPALDNSDACVALGTQRKATAHLAAPLGLRHVLESVGGQEVYTTLLP